MSKDDAKKRVVAALLSLSEAIGDDTLKTTDLKDAIEIGIASGHGRLVVQLGMVSWAVQAVMKDGV